MGGSGHRLRAGLLGAAFLGLAGTAVQAQDVSGRAVEVLPDVAAARAGNVRNVVAMQPVYMGDRIQTGPVGQAQLLFSDETRLVVGPGSSLMLEQYLLQSASTNTVSRFSINALRGTFRFITGDSPKPSYAIKTPTATIGIRGTEFDLNVRPNGQTQFVLLSGAATICGAGSCIEATQACSMVEIPRGGAPRQITSMEDRDRRLKADFPYVSNQNATVRQDFRAQTSSCSDQRAVLEGKPIAPPAPVVAAVRVPPPPPPPPPPVVTPPGNPGNGKPVGNSGENPGKGNFGNDGVKGKGGGGTGGGGNAGASIGLDAGGGAGGSSNPDAGNNGRGGGNGNAGGNGNGNGRK
ncbi:FecR family protein [Alsobacter ponti]|uniref:FecR family protein n=1 Tax=Alsobacter ponti TaxID=2962936 RepID=UPI0035310065